MTASYQETQIAKTRKMIARWQGRPAMIYEICRSHYCLRLVVSGENSSENLVVAVAEPEYIHGPTRWTECDIKLVPATLRSGDEGIAVLDERNDVRIVGEAFEVHENVKL